MEVPSNNGAAANVGSVAGLSRAFIIFPWVVAPPWQSLGRYARRESNAMNEKPKTPFQKFQALAKGLVKVPKPELDKKIRELRASKSAKKRNRHET